MAFTVKYVDTESGLVVEDSLATKLEPIKNGSQYLLTTTALPNEVFIRQQNFIEAF